jgi:hypothetical protein
VCSQHSEQPALIRGISFAGAHPTLDYTGADGNGALELRAGDWLRFSVREGPRLCLGVFSVSGPTTAAHLPCPTAGLAVHGHQCGGCFARDDFRLVHNVHRDGPGGRVLPAGLSAYLSQEHWLYLATFADGATKVGTASARSKFSRLAEQGAVVARYVALAQDGRTVRILEDAVSSGLKLPQGIRAAAKLQALLAPLPAGDLEAINARHAARARELLESVQLEGFRSVQQQWERPQLAAAVCGPGARHGYPWLLDAGAHGLRLISLLGSCALVRLDGSDADFLLDFGRLKGRSIHWGAFSSQIPALQEALF